VDEVEDNAILEYNKQRQKLWRQVYSAAINEHGPVTSSKKADDAVRMMDSQFVDDYSGRIFIFGS